MGLDMYLTKRYYVKNWDHTSEDMRWHITAYRGTDPRRVKAPELTFTIPTDEITGITCEAGYWRKANAIHQWFVDNCQSGEDDCRDAYVPQEKLQELLDLVDIVLGDHSQAEYLLPVSQGFFFGNYEYDEYYFEDLENTKNILEKALADDSGVDFYYQSSW